MYIHNPQVFGDARGEFAEWFKRSALGCEFDLAQANISTSKAGVLRGMHFGYGQAKYVTCAQGSLFDVAVDLRRNSPNYLQPFTVELSAAKHNAIYIPAGFAHGFVALEDAVAVYLTNTEYDPQREFEFNAFDLDVAIAWPAMDYILSDKDKAAPTWAEVAATIDLEQLL